MITTLLILCVCAGGFVHGFTGFGAAMVIMALLPLLKPFPEALFFSAFLTLPIAAWTLWRYRHALSWREGAPLWIGAVIGTPIGLLIVDQLDRTQLLRLLGVMLIVFPLNELFLAQRWRLPIPLWFGLPIGILCGILGAAFGVGGPPAIIFVYARPGSREWAVATLQCMFLINSGLRVIATATSVVTAELAWICALAVVPYMLAGMAGAKLAERVPPARFKQIVLLLLIVMGVFHLVRN